MQTRASSSPDLLELLRAQRAWSRALALRLVRDGDEADDIVQEAQLAALRSPPRVDAPLRPWLAAVIRNLVLDRAKARARAAKRHEEAEAIREAVPAADALLAEAQAHQRLTALVLDLREPFREAVLLRYFEGLSGAEIARAQGVPEGTVRWRLKTAVDELRARLDETAGGDRERWKAALLPLLRVGTAAPQSGATPSAGPLVGGQAGSGGLLFAGSALVALLVVALSLALSFAPSRRAAPRAGLAGPSSLARQATSPVGSAGGAGPVGAPGAFEITVVGEAGRPLPGALVAFVDARETGARARSVGAADETGRFRLAGLPPSDYALTASAPGHLSKTVARTVAAGEPVRLVIVLPPGGASLTGTVVDASGGVLAGASVRLSRSASPSALEPLGGPPPGVFRSLTDEAGRFQLGVESGFYGLSVAADGYVPATAHFMLLGNESRQIELEPAATVGGTVRDRRTGLPVAGARVRLERGSKARSLGDATTDDDGHFQIGGVPAGRYVVAASKGTAIGRTPAPVAAEVGAETAVSLLLDEGRRISGRVLGGAGRPLAGALVWYERGRAPAPNRSYEPVQSTRSDADGRFTFEGLEPEPFVVRAEADGHAPAAVFPVELRDGDRTGLDLRLAAGLPVSGRVLTPEGKGLAGVAVDIEVKENDQPRAVVTARHRVWSGRDGAFSARRFGPGVVQVRAFAPDYGVAAAPSARLSSGAGVTVVVRFSRPAFIEGRVRFDDGAPAAQAHVTWRADEKANRDPETIVDAQGRFRIGPLGGGAGILEASWPELTGSFSRTSVPGREPARPERASLTIGEGERRTGIELVLPRTDKTIEGFVLDPEGAPLEGAAIELEPDTSAADWVPQIAHRTCVSGGDGRFTRVGLARGTYVVKATHPRFHLVVRHGVRAGDRAVQLRFAPPAELVGVVVDERGQPVRSFTVAAEPEQPAGRLVFRTGAGPAYRQPVKDSGGRFALGPLPEGRFVLYATTEDGRAGGLSSVALRVGERREGLRLVLAPGVTLRGSVLDPQGRPAPDVVVRIAGMEDAEQARTDRAGRFRIDGLVPGRSILIVPDPARDFSSSVRKIQLPDRGEIEIEPLRL